MRATVTLRERIAAAIKPWDTDANRTAYAAGDFPRAESCRDRHMRYRWDLYWASLRTDPGIRVAVEAEGLTDAHLDTVLRGTVAPFAR